jgi:hypothetical protein
MSGEDADAVEERQRARRGAGRAWLELLRPAVLAVVAMLVSLAFSSTWPPANQFLLHRSVDLLVLVMYFWEFARYRPSFFEFAGIGLTSAGFLFLVFKGAWLMPVVIVAMAVLWLLLSWIAQQWPLQRGLTMAALFGVILRLAMLALRMGGHMGAEDAWPRAVDLGFLALLGVIALTSSQAWRGRRFAVPEAGQFQAGFFSAPLVVAVVLRLWPWGPALSAGTQGWVDAGFALLAGVTAWSARRWTWGGLRWMPPALMIMPMNQLILALYSKVSANTLVPMLHQLNGLLIFCLAVFWACLVWAELSRHERSSGLS